MNQAEALEAIRVCRQRGLSLTGLFRRDIALDAVMNPWPLCGVDLKVHCTSGFSNAMEMQLPHGPEMPDLTYRLDSAILFLTCPAVRLHQP
jgi:hypothetical protein